MDGIASKQPYSGRGRVLTGNRHMIAAGHHPAAHAGFLILEAGGSAIDAGVAAGIALGALHGDIVNVAGVAPIMIRLADSQEVDHRAWRLAQASAEFFGREHGRIQDGLLRTDARRAGCLDRRPRTLWHEEFGEVVQSRSASRPRDLPCLCANVRLGEWHVRPTSGNIKFLGATASHPLRACRRYTDCPRCESEHSARMRAYPFLT